MRLVRKRAVKTAFDTEITEAQRTQRKSNSFKNAYSIGGSADPFWSHKESVLPISVFSVSLCTLC